MSGANSASMRVASDDDLGMYRSLSTFAVISLILGLLSILSFAPTNLFLWIIPPAAIVTGLVALRQIASAPEVWTGIRLARLGIGLAVVCGGGSLGEKYYSNARIARQGRAVAERFIDKLKGGDIEAAFWLTMPREQRDQIQKLKSDKVPTELMERYGGFREGVHEYADAMASGEVHLEFDRVEKTSRDRGTEYASVVFRVHSPKGDSHALILASSFHGPRGPSWFIRDHRFDYTPGSFEAPVVSGHGHSH